MKPIAEARRCRLVRERFGPNAFVVLLGLGAAACGAESEPPVDAAPSCTEDPALRLAYVRLAEDAIENGGDVYGLTADGEERRLTDDGGSASPDISPDGSQVVFESIGEEGSVSDTNGPSRRELQIMNAVGSDRRRLTDGDADLDPAWSPDGETVLFVRQADNSLDDGTLTDGQLHLVDADGSDVRPLLDEEDPAQLRQQSPAWSPDGERVAFLEGSDDESGDDQRLVTIDSDGGDREVLAEGDFVGAPAWSPDGQSIAYATISPGEANGPLFEVSVVDAESGEKREVISPASGPSWSADGSRLLLLARPPAVSDFSGTWRVTEVELGGEGVGRPVAGTSEVGFLYDGYEVSSPACTPDGNTALTGPEDVAAAETVMDPASGDEVAIMPRSVAIERAASPASVPTNRRVGAKIVTAEDLEASEADILILPGGPRLLWLIAFEDEPFGHLEVLDAETGALVQSGGAGPDPFPVWWDELQDLSAS